tara:strand:+ start:4904 stop:5470 length:567 start_codon:yes stop_codon:yes gene_type:complete
MGILSRQQLMDIGFKSIGENILLSDKASIYGAANISIGSNVRIDDFVVLSAGKSGIEIGNYIHIAIFSSLIGEGKISLSDFCNISSRVSVYSSNDDYSGSAMTNPMIPEKFKMVTHADVFIGRHALIGAASVILPGIIIGEGAVVGALSLVNRSCAEFTIYAGVPIKKIKARKRDLLNYEAEFALTGK